MKHKNENIFRSLVLSLLFLSVSCVFSQIARGSDDHQNDFKAMSGILTNYLRAQMSHNFSEQAKYIAASELVNFKNIFKPVFDELPKYSQEQRSAVFEIFIDTNDITNVASATPQEFFVMVMKKSERFHFKIPSAQITPLGYVGEKSGLNHLVYRYEAKDLSTSDVKVCSFKKETESWRILLTEDIKTVAQLKCAATVLKLALFQADKQKVSDQK
jgi:hypothetical protein